jgi:hypothetical protein
MGDVRVNGTTCDVVDGSPREPRSTASRTPRNDDASRSNVGGPRVGDEAAEIIDPDGDDTLRLIITESADADITEATAVGVLRRTEESVRGEPGGASPRERDLFVAGVIGDAAPASSTLACADGYEMIPPPTRDAADANADEDDPWSSDVSETMKSYVPCT